VNGQKLSGGLIGIDMETTPIKSNTVSGQPWLLSAKVSGTLFLEDGNAARMTGGPADLPSAATKAKNMLSMRAHLS
jgi:hypothetical protein